MFSDKWTTEMRTGHRLRRLQGANRAYDVALALPDEPAPAEGFALLILTDGALHFDAVASAAAALARRSAKTGVGPTIVAGIASGLDWSHDPARRAEALVSDGADAAGLLAVVETLVGKVAGLAPLDPARRAMMGHSLGGLFALHALAQAPALFGTAIAISPSFWRMPALPARVGQAIAGRGARIFLASGGREHRINAALPDAERALMTEGVTLQRRLHEEEDHGSIVFAALPEALRFLHDLPRQA